MHKGRYRRIDTHVHCGECLIPDHGEKPAMQILIEDAAIPGIYKVFDMPNRKNPVTKNYVTNEYEVKARLKFASAWGLLQNYGIYIAATADAGQLSEAARIASKNPFVPGIKAFMGPSVGPLEIVDEDKQRLVYTTLANDGYKGVLALHCEDKSLFKPDMWNSDNPVTHCLARPLEAEIISVEKNLGYAIDAGFEGTILGCHLTSPKSIELFKKANEEHGLNVAVEVSPHHNILSMKHMGPLGALGGKMNPPLRAESEQKELLESSKYETQIPIVVGTDNARHPFFKKIEEPYMSGFGVEVYTVYETLLSEIGRDASVSNNRVKEITFDNVVDVFGKKKCGII